MSKSNLIWNWKIIITKELLPYWPWGQWVGVMTMTYAGVAWLTVKHCTAVLGGGGERLAGVVQFVSIVTDADLKLDWLARIVDHAGIVEDRTEAVLPPSLVFLKVENVQEKRGGRVRGSRGGTGCGRWCEYLTRGGKIVRRFIFINFFQNITLNFCIKNMLFFQPTK